MKRRSFIRNISSLGLASVAVGTSFAAETPQSNSLPGKSKIPVYDGWDVIESFYELLLYEKRSRI